MGKITKCLTIARAIIRMLVSKSLYAGWASLILATGIIVVAATGRYFFNHPLIYEVELSQVLMVPLAFLTFGYVFLVQGHVKVDLLTSHLNQSLQDWLLLFSRFLAIIFGIIFCISTCYYVGNSFNLEIKMQSTLWLLAPFQITMPVGLGLMVLYLLVEVCEELHKKLIRNKKKE